MLSLFVAGIVFHRAAGLSTAKALQSRFAAHYLVLLLLQFLCWNDACVGVSGCVCVWVCVCVGVLVFMYVGG